MCFSSASTLRPVQPAITRCLISRRSMVRSSVWAIGSNQVPFAVVELDDIHRFERVAILSERNRTFQGRKILHGTDRVADGGTFGRKLGRVSGYVGGLHGLG